MNSSVDTDLVFVSALSVWNRALDAHRGEARNRQILRGLQNHPERRAAVELYDQDPQEPLARYVLRFHNGLIEPGAAVSGSEPVVWRPRVDYLETVVANSDALVKNPARLRWQWLKDWAGVDD